MYGYGNRHFLHERDRYGRKPWKLSSERCSRSQKVAGDAVLAWRRRDRSRSESCPHKSKTRQILCNSIASAPLRWGDTAMSLEKGRYYTRSHRVNGRIVRTYLGSGEIAQAMAESDRIARDRRNAERAALQAELAEMTNISKILDELDATCKHLVEVYFESQGYHRHHRGAWRKRRGS
jgi:hypothetical protein